MFCSEQGSGLCHTEQADSSVANTQFSKGLRAVITSARSQGLGRCQENVGFTEKECFDTIRTGSSENCCPLTAVNKKKKNDNKVRLDLVLDAKSICNQH